MKLTRNNVSKLFGQEDSAQESGERLNEYFVKNSAYNDAMSDQNIVILVGHKGSGKSAVLNRAHNELSNTSISINIDPTTILAGIEVSDNINYNAIVSHWQERIQQVVADEIIKKRFDVPVDNAKLQSIAISTGQLVTSIRTYLRKSNRQSIKHTDDLIIENFISGDTSIYVHLDDLDQGWTSSKSDIKKISAILSAIRSITQRSEHIKFRITLRSDIYFLVRTSDESTDKIEGFVSWVNWSGHQILVLLCKRILTFFGEPAEDDYLLNLEQSYMSAHIFSRIMDAKYIGRGKWKSRPIHNILTSLVRRSRPRDMVKLLTMAAQNAGPEAENISSIHFQNILESYSNGRIVDIENEYRSELPDIEYVIRGMKPNQKQRRTSDSFVYTTADLVTKLNNIRSTKGLSFTNGKHLSAKSLIQFLYKIDFITGRKKGPDGIIRHHFDSNQFLISEVNDMGYDWEVHPAYRWALEPDDKFRILETITPPQEE